MNSGSFLFSRRLFIERAVALIFHTTSFGDDLPVEKIDYPMSIGGIVLGVSHHYDGRTFLIQFGQ